jgi:hypothetical protein
MTITSVTSRSFVSCPTSDDESARAVLQTGEALPVRRRSRKVAEPIPLDRLVSDLVVATRLFKQFQRTEIALHLRVKAIERMLSSEEGLGSADAPLVFADVAGSEDADPDAHDTLLSLVGSVLEDESDLMPPDVQTGAVALVTPKSRTLTAELLAEAGALPIIECRDHIAAYRKAAARNVEKLAKQLPIASWVSDIRGAGLRNLGMIIGETGDLSLYANPAKVWKRMGLAVGDDGRAQRRIAGVADPSRGRTKQQAVDEAIGQGYSPRRRTVMHLLGECLIKGNTTPDGDGYYRIVYAERKAYELARAPEMRPIVAHKRAMRYMEKRFLLHLWQAWRRETICEPSPL